MEYVAGSTLSVWRKQFDGGKVPVDQAIEICRKVAKALDFAHSQKIIHRDIKPANIMVSYETVGAEPAEDNTNQMKSAVKVLDFGLAAEIRSSMSRVSREQGDTSGTRPYMAPEQWTGKKQGAYTDQYALAVLFYELVSGEVPFHSVFETGDAILMMNVVKAEQPDPVEELDNRQWKSLSRALSKEPSERYVNCVDLIVAFGGGKTGKNKATKTRHNSENGSSLKMVLSIFLVVLIAGGYFGYSKYQQGVEDQKRVEKLAQERQEKVDSSFAASNDAFSASRYAEALKEIKKILVIEPANSQAQLMSQKVTQALGLAKATPLKIKAEKLWTGIKDFNREQAFGIKLDALDALLKTAATYFNQKEYDSAIKEYQRFIPDVESLTGLNESRLAVLKQITQLDKLLTDTKRFKASMTVIKRNEAALATYKNAKNTFSNGAIAAAGKAFADAEALLKIVVEEAQVSRKTREKRRQALEAGASNDATVLWKSAENLFTLATSSEQVKALESYEKARAIYTSAIAKAGALQKVRKAAFAAHKSAEDNNISTGNVTLWRGAEQKITRAATASYDDQLSLYKSVTASYELALAKLRKQFYSSRSRCAKLIPKITNEIKRRRVSEIKRISKTIDDAEACSKKLLWWKGTKLFDEASTILGHEIKKETDRLKLIAYQKQQLAARNKKLSEATASKKKLLVSRGGKLRQIKSAFNDADYEGGPKYALYRDKHVVSFDFSYNNSTGTFNLSCNDDLHRCWDDDSSREGDVDEYEGYDKYSGNISDIDYGRRSSYSDCIGFKRNSISFREYNNHDGVSRDSGDCGTIHFGHMKSKDVRAIRKLFKELDALQKKINQCDKILKELQ